MMSLRSVIPALLAGLVVHPTPSVTEASVNGRVQLIERPGESTSDLASVVVYLDVPQGVNARVVPTNTSMALHDRSFSPTVRIVTAGSQVDFPNQDRFSHNVFTKAPAGPYDSEVFGRGRTRSNVFRNPSVYPLYCNIHPKMSGFVVAVRTPWFAQADESGRFSIPGVPPGTYTMHLWHPRAAEQVQTVVVPPTGLDALTFQLDARGYKYVAHKNKYGQDYINAAGDRY